MDHKDYKTLYNQLYELIWEVLEYQNLQGNHTRLDYSEPGDYPGLSGWRVYRRTEHGEIPITKYIGMEEALQAYVESEKKPVGSSDRSQVLKSKLESLIGEMNYYQKALQENERLIENE